MVSGDLALILFISSAVVAGKRAQAKDLAPWCHMMHLRPSAGTMNIGGQEDYCPSPQEAGGMGQSLMTSWRAPQAQPPNLLNPSPCSLSLLASLPGLPGPHKTYPCSLAVQLPVSPALLILLHSVFLTTSPPNHYFFLKIAKHWERA